MYKTGKINISTVIPDKLSYLKEISNNLWWTWNHNAKRIFKQIDSELWDNTNQNPVAFLRQVNQLKLVDRLSDENFMSLYSEVVDEYKAYIGTRTTRENIKIAYFSAEYGLHHSVPIYSGGLGVLSGDHCKSASDLNIPFTAVGLFYKQGYFMQKINQEGWQETEFSQLSLSSLPLSPVHDENGDSVYISVDLAGRSVSVKIWELNVGRIKLYLLDSDVEGNTHEDRSITARLYGGDHETRIQQEIILGIGGSRALDALGIKPDVYHMNEGHSSFLGLELLRKLIHDNGLSFDAARQVCSSMLAFTSHTPVPAGNDVFHEYLIDKYLTNFWILLKIDRMTFMGLGSRTYDNNFNMTILALKLSGIKNGVSELHGAVTRNMFNDLWSNIPEDEVPITHITNGVHTLSWISSEFYDLYNKYMPSDWVQNIHDPKIWSNVNDIPSTKIWEAHCKLKHDLADYLSNESTELIFNPDALTIGFARRFATYKRADLIFRDIKRLAKLANDSQRPIQLIFAGKAHPADRPAQEIIKKIHEISKSNDFRNKVIVLENYDISIAMKLVSGVDVWLNNPRRPLEASGTSGQKVCINGIVNFSVLDGWWCEGYNEENGWIIGDDTFYPNEHLQDRADSESLYATLENRIIPAYYDRNSDGVPEKWVQIMKQSIVSVTPLFSTNRMVTDYYEKIYKVLMQKHTAIIENNYKKAYELSEWKSYISSKWQSVSIKEDSLNKQSLKSINALMGKNIAMKAIVHSNGIDPHNLKVELYYGILDKQGFITNANTVDMALTETLDNNTLVYSTDFHTKDSGEYSYTFRVYPINEELINQYDTGLIKWVY